MSDEEQQPRIASPPSQLTMSSEVTFTPDLERAMSGHPHEHEIELPADGDIGSLTRVPSCAGEVLNEKALKNEDPFAVRWDDENDPMCPLNKAKWRKWTMVVVLAVSCICVTCCSSMASDTYPGMIETFHVSEEVCTLSISILSWDSVLDLVILLGPVSEFVGRKPVLHYSFLAFFLLNFPVAFAPNVAVHMIFRFFTGFAGSSFLSVSGGAITDVFHNSKVATPMMIFSAAPFIGPVAGPLFSGFINQQQPDWRWTYYVILIWAGCMMSLLVAFVPETFDPKLLKKKAKKLRKSTGDDRYRAPIENLNRSFIGALQNSVKTPFVLLITQPMVLFLDLWSALILGILYLSFGGVPFIFKHQHNFNVQDTGMAFLGIGAGMIIAAGTQPYFNKKYRAAVVAGGGVAPPESRLVVGMYGAVLCPVGLLLMGLTSFKSVHWIVPILMSTLFGAGIVYSFTSTFTYLVDAYRPVAASALASNSFLRSSFAAGFPLFGLQLYTRLGAVGGTCLLAGLLFLTVPLPFIFYRIGARVRAKSSFGTK